MRLQMMPQQMTRRLLLLMQVAPQMMPQQMTRLLMMQVAPQMMPMQMTRLLMRMKQTQTTKQLPVYHHPRAAFRLRFGWALGTRFLSVVCMKYTL